MALTQFTCANWDPSLLECKKAGTFTCKNCLLVVYCGPACQKLHWPRHKTDCKGPLNRETWKPAWVVEFRVPDFVHVGPGVGFGANKYLWGNLPAFDVLQLESNEGEGYEGDLSLLFAASGDLRNVVKTVTQLPNTFNRSIGITINDRDLDITARNLILLLTALVAEDIDETVDCMIHVWYSALLRKSDLDLLQTKIRPLLENVYENIKSKGPMCVLGKTWTFGERSLRITLRKSSWDKLLSYLDIPEGLTSERAHQVRTANTMAKTRRDYVDRHLVCHSRPHRVAITQFRKDGILLPFGSSRQDFQVPNPTIFQTADVWPMKDNADPLCGWPAEEVAQTLSGAATADIYGKLFYYLRSLFRTFLARVSNSKVSFQLFQVDAADLPDYLSGESFSRIETSNIADGGYLGVARTLFNMIPLLQKPLVNEHATLLTLFMNAVQEVLDHSGQDRPLDAKERAAMKGLLKYLPLGKPVASPFDPESIKFMVGRDAVVTYDEVFDRYMKQLKFDEMADITGAAMKTKHTIIDKWPYRLKLRPGQPGAQEEFDRFMTGTNTTKERYVEWKRAPKSAG